MSYEKNPPVMAYPSEMKRRAAEQAAVTVPRDPFVFTDPTEIEFFGSQPAFTLKREHDGRTFTYAGCKPEFHDDAVSFNVEKVLVTWTDKEAS